MQESKTTAAPDNIVTVRTKEEVITATTKSLLRISMEEIRSLDPKDLKLFANYLYERRENPVTQEKSISESLLSKNLINLLDNSMYKPLWESMNFILKTDKKTGENLAGSSDLPMPLIEVLSESEHPSVRKLVVERIVERAKNYTLICIIPSGAEIIRQFANEDEDKGVRESANDAFLKLFQGHSTIRT